MTVSVVNGYACYSSCDVSKAKKGQDPHPATGPAKIDEERAASSLGRGDQPAVVFGGSLLRVSGTDRVTAAESDQPASPTTLPSAGLSVDLLA
jgi:hypothetical protein